MAWRLTRRVSHWSIAHRRAYCDWQNNLTRPAELAANRFVEIPALHQTGVFTREAIVTVLAATRGCYRDGPAPFAGDEGAVGATLDVPVDLWWWLEFFARGLACGRVRSPPVWKSNVASMAWGY